MKAPDKIYIQQDMINNLILEEREYADDVEYIHKEALLEWAKETYLSENASAIRKVCFKQLIEKLNEM